MQKRKIQSFLALLAVLSCSLFGCSVGERPPVQKSDVAMGSVVSVKLYGMDEKMAEKTAEQMLLRIQTLDRDVLSKNNTTSEVAKCNQNPQPQMPMPVSEELMQVLQKTKEIYAHSNGQAALMSGALTEIWGMDIDAFRVPKETEIQKALPLCQDDTAILTEKTVAFLKGQKLNLGSVGKGLACDVALEAYKAQENPGSGVLVSVGGSLGVLGSPKADTPFTVGIRNPFGDVNSYFATLKIQDGFLSTSGSYEKQFTENGKTYHHLLDLTTGYPKETELCSVTVLAPSGLESDALSTLCFLLGEEASLPILKEYHAEAVFVYQNANVSATEGIQKDLTITDAAFQMEGV